MNPAEKKSEIQKNMGLFLEQLPWKHSKGLLYRGDVNDVYFTASKQNKFWPLVQLGMSLGALEATTHPLASLEDLGAVKYVARVYVPKDISLFLKLCEKFKLDPDWDHVNYRAEKMGLHR